MDPYDQVPAPGQLPEGRPVPDRDFWEPKTRSPWRVVGVVAAVLLAVLGLAIGAIIVLFFVGMASYGSNK